MKRKNINISLIILSFVILSCLTGCQQEKMKLKSDVQIEYGNTISTDAKDYLSNDEEFLKDVLVENIPANEENKNYPPVGEYEITLKKGNTEEKEKVVVKDTTAPEFKTIQDEYEVKTDSKFDISKIEVTELSEFSLVLDDKEVDYSKDGNYEAVIIAKDKYENESKKQIKIIIKQDAKNTESTADDKKQTEVKASQATQKKEVSSSSGNSKTDKSNSSSESKKDTSEKQSNNKSDNQSTSKPKEEDSSSNQSPEKPKSFVDSLKVSKKYSKIFIVSSKSYSSRQGTFTYYHKIDNEWKKEFTTTADLGKTGIGTASENAKTTPVGQFTFTKLMGINSNPGTKLNYHQIDSNDYWCGETYYNQFIDEDVQEHNCSKKNDEHLSEYPSQYKYAAAFNYNPGNVKGKGFAYFLHCSNSIHYTGGCIAIPTNNMLTVMQQIDNNTVMIIDLEKNISNY